MTTRDPDAIDELERALAELKLSDDIKQLLRDIKREVGEAYESRLKECWEARENLWGALSDLMDVFYSEGLIDLMIPEVEEALEKAGAVLNLRALDMPPDFGEDEEDEE